MTSTSTPAARPANLREYRKVLAAAQANLAVAESAVAAFALTYELQDSPVVSDALGAAWNAAHDAVTALEAEVRQIEVTGYGRDRRDANLAALVAANID